MLDTPELNADCQDMLEALVARQVEFIIGPTHPVERQLLSRRGQVRTCFAVTEAELFAEWARWRLGFDGALQALTGPYRL